MTWAEQLQHELAVALVVDAIAARERAAAALLAAEVAVAAAHRCHALEIALCRAEEPGE